MARQKAGVTQGHGSRRNRIFPPSRGWVIGVVIACGVLTAGGLTAVSFIGTGTAGGARPAAIRNITVSGTAGAGTSNVASAKMPQIAAAPRIAVLPKAPASGTAGAARSGSSAAAPPPAPGSGSCAKPSFVTSDQYGMWNQDPYFVYNNMWGISGYHVKQTLYACSSSNWYVVATMDNNRGDGAVKTYPNSHRDFSNKPVITSQKSITSTFAETSPGTGIYEDAYDIWLNGIASSGSTEVMIWTENHGQVPAGSDQGTVSIDGRSYTEWKTPGNYVAFVANSNFTSGTMNLLAFFQWIIAKGWIPASSTLGQVDYGVELVSTNGVPATFTFSDFSVNAS